MKIVIEIPKEFEHDFNADRFIDSLSRLSVDASNIPDDGLSGIYEAEICDMLIESLRNAEVIE